MRQTTAITQAYMRYARAYEQWHKDCQHIPIKVAAPRVLYLPGRGYEINGEERRETADIIIASLNAATRECLELIEFKCKPTAPSVYERFGNVEPISEAESTEEVAREF